MSSFFIEELGRFTVEWRKDTNCFHVVEDVDGHFFDRGQGHIKKARAIAHAKRLFKTEKGE